MATRSREAIAGELALVNQQLDEISGLLEEKRQKFADAESDYIDAETRYDALLTRRAELTKEIEENP